MSDDQRNVSRRTFMKASGALGVVAIGGGSLAAVASPAGTSKAIADTGIAEDQRAFFFDPDACISCQTCVAACRSKNNIDESYRNVYRYSGKSESGPYAYSVSLGCCFCIDPACIKVCPTHAMHRTEEFGFVDVDPSRCIGCGYCDMACPYNVPRVDKEKGHSVKCNGCPDLVSQGELPACAASCPAEALFFGTAEEMGERGVRANIAPLPSPSYTAPNLFIAESENTLPAGDTSGEATNLSEGM